LGNSRRGRRGEPSAADARLIDRFFSAYDSDGSSTPPGADDRKLKQLVREAYRVLSQAVGELVDRRLASAFVVEVRPAPDGSRLAVCVSAGSGADPADVLAALDAARGVLRAELASAIARKRTPELSFEVVP
jgi:ribosome-binding factor A